MCMNTYENDHKALYKYKQIGKIISIYFCMFLMYVKAYYILLKFSTLSDFFCQLTSHCQWSDIGTEISN